jgi:RHS repeat-associated protein
LRWEWAARVGCKSVIGIVNWPLPAELARGPVRVDGSDILCRHLKRWDGAGKLRRIRENATGSTLYSAEYDAEGTRVRSVQGGVTHTYSYGAGLLKDASSAGNITYTPGINQRTGTTDLYYHQDWLGSTRYLSDSTGLNAPNAYRFDAYGSQSAFAGTDSTKQKWIGGLGYQSDLPGGMMHVGARAYDPVVGRFISPDPIGFAGGLNLYGYCGSNPVGAVDPSGLMSESEWDLLHGGLDVLGLVPVYGEVADLANAGAYAGRGRWSDAGLSAVGAVPVIGWLATGAKAFKWLDKFGAMAQFARRMGKSKAARIAGECSGEGARFAGEKPIDLWRAVSPDEYGDLVKNGVFNPSPFGSQGKYFWGSHEDAQKYLGIAQDRGWDYTDIIRTSAPSKAIDYTGTMDGMIGHFVRNEQLPLLAPPILKP